MTGGSADSRLAGPLLLSSTRFVWGHSPVLVEKGLGILEALVRFAAEGSLLMNSKIVLVRKELVIAHASRPEGLANF